MKTVQSLLRHSPITVTAGTYTTALPEVALAAAEIIPRTATRQLGLVSGTLPTTVDSQRAEETLPDNTNPQVTFRTARARQCRTLSSSSGVLCVAGWSRRANIEAAVRGSPVLADDTATRHFCRR
jgi:hypothetical protein